MDLRKLKTLVDLVSESGICELEVTEGEDKVRIVNKPSMMAPNMQMNMPANYNHHYVQDSANYTASKPLNVQPLEVDAQDVVDLKNAMNSPMVGSFYRASSPGNPPFVNVGDSVKVGQTICIIEAMKLLNEIQAEKDGVIKAILVENGQAVQFDDPLFIIE